MTHGVYLFMQVHYISNTMCIGGMDRNIIEVVLGKIALNVKIPSTTFDLRSVWSVSVADRSNLPMVYTGWHVMLSLFSAHWALNIRLFVSVFVDIRMKKTMALSITVSITSILADNLLLPLEPVWCTMFLLIFS